MSIRGTLDSAQLHELLRRISSREERGLLSIQGEQDLVSMTFERGAIVAADAMNHPADEMLGEVLANEGWLSPSEFESALGRELGTGRLASQVLAEAGLVDDGRLLRAVRLQTLRQGLRVLRWRNGNFDWTAGVESPYHEGVEPISVAELLLRASEELGSDGPLRGAVPDLDAVFEHNPDRSLEIQPLEEAPETDSTRPQGDVVWLTRNERKVYHAADGRQPGSMLLLQLGLDPFEVKYALYYLLRCGLLRISHQVAATGPLHADLATGLRSADVLGRREPPEAAGAALRLDEGLLGPAEKAPPASREPSGELSPLPHLSELDTATTGLEGLGDGEPAVPVRVRRQPWAEIAAPWLARGLGLALIAVFAMNLLLPRQRAALHLPFAWLAPERAAFERAQRASLYDKIDHAIRTYHLLYGRDPEELSLLADLQLLNAVDLYDPEGLWLSYVATEDGYRVEPQRGGKALTGLAAERSVDGHFLIRPRYLIGEASTPDRAVVLLD